MSEEPLMNQTQWREEAQSVIDDIKHHVSKIEIFDGDNSRIFFNLTTKEDAPFCVELSAQGFRVVGFSHDSRVVDDNEYFETPYSLLDQISPMYRTSVANELTQKLNELNKLSGSKNTQV